MNQISYLRDASFLDALTKEKVKTVYTRINLLNKDELPIEKIEGKITTGSINIQGNSAVRRTGSLTFVVKPEEADVTNVNNIISINKKVSIFIGVENSINPNYEKIIWFPLGIFVIVQPNISHGVTGTTVSISFKDKMCLLNGECGGGLPASIIFHEYDQIIGYQNVDELPTSEINDYTIYECNNYFYKWDNNYGWIGADPVDIGTYITRPQRIFDIVQTLVLNYAEENPAKVFINDIPLEIKSSVRYTGSGALYYDSATGRYTLDEREVTNTFREFGYNNDVGYVYTDFTYPGELVSGIGESVTSVLDKIKNALGNFEYFYDVNGNFIFQEIKNYLNNSYDITNTIEENNSILNKDNYKVGFNNATKSVYTFEEGGTLISSFSNAPNYSKIKNDFHVWGENKDGYVVHYHVAIKEKPTIMNVHKVVFLKDNDGLETGGIRLAGENEEQFENYIPEDWRAEVYLQGLEKRKLGQRPDSYEQELLDLFDSIYDFKQKKYKTDMASNSNNLKYFIDFLEPTDELYNYSVEAIGKKTYSYKQDNVNRLFNSDIPNKILINLGHDKLVNDQIKARCLNEGQDWAQVPKNVYDSLAIGTSGYSAHESARELLYQYTNYGETISIQSVPMYYLDANMRISVYDKASAIYGDYIINSISLPLDGKPMSISASRALERL